VKPTDWPSSFRTHYEFYRTSKGIGVELHLESDAAKPLSKTLQPFAGTVLADGQPPLLWDQSWNSGRGRLMCRFPPDADPALPARAMMELINRTRSLVAEHLNETAAT
jgi:hypothetical protein